MLARAAGLGEPAREVLDAAALIGTRIELPLLTSVTGCPPPALDELVACGLLVDDGDGLRFRHEIARLAVSQGVPGHRRAGIHRRIVDVLGAAGSPDDARLAFHAEAAGDAAAVLRYAPRAARRAAELGAHREAAAQFERALRFTGQAAAARSAAEPGARSTAEPGARSTAEPDVGFPGQTEVRSADQAEAAQLAGLDDGLADELALVERLGDAARAAEQAVGRWHEIGDQRREGDMRRRQARILWMLCRESEAAAATRAALALLEPLGPSAELAWAHATSAARQMLRGELAAAAGSARRAEAIAEQCGDAGALSDARNTLAVCAARTGQDGWEALMQRALEGALAAGRAEQAARAYANLCALYKERSDFAATERYAAAGLAYCDEHDLTAYATFLSSERANVWLGTGRWAESAAVSQDILDNLESSPSDRCCALIRLGTLRARQGQPRVWPCLDDAATIARGSGERPAQVSVALARAEAYWLESRTAEAAREAEAADDASAEYDAWTRGAIDVWLARTGSDRTSRGPVAGPYRLELGHDPVRAAQAWTEVGRPYEAALALGSSPAHAHEALRILSGLGAAPAVRLVEQRSTVRPR